MKHQILQVVVIALVCSLVVTGFVASQQPEDIKPGQTFPRPGYLPDPNKVVYVIFWHHKKQVDQFGYQDYFMDKDGVNDTTARKMKKLMEERYPNLAVYVKETNERDVESVVERERKRIKFIEIDWVDVKQPVKIRLPQNVGDKKYDYPADNPKLIIDESATKAKGGKPKARNIPADAAGTYTNGGEQNKLVLDSSGQVTIYAHTDYLNGGKATGTLTLKEGDSFVLSAAGRDWPVTISKNKFLIIYDDDGRKSTTKAALTFQTYSFSR
jgi:hypothetical protein